MTVAEAQTGGRCGPARGGPAALRGGVHALGAVLAALGRADRAADLAAVVLPHGRAGRAGDRGGRARRGADRPEQWKRVYLDWMREHPARGASRASSGGATGSRSGTATLRGDRRSPRTSARERPPAAAEVRCARRTCSTPGSARRCGPSRRSAGPTDDPLLRGFYPTDFLTTAREIIFLWVARMVMMGLEFAGDIPFDDVYVHSVIQAPDGRRMSKSLGTGIDPLDEIDVHGADALRFGLLAMSSSQDVRYSADRVQQGRDLANKMWNASRLVLLNAHAEQGPGRSSSVPRIAGSSRACRRTIALGDGEARRLRLRARGAGPLRVLLVGALRLVPGDGQAPPVRRRARGGGEPALRARAGAGAGPPDDAVRDRGDLGLPARRGGARPAGGRRVPARPIRSLVDDDGRGRGSGRRSS